MDRLTSMAVFTKAVDLGSLSAAGNALEISGQMAGKHIQFLERRLGGRLLVRTTRRQNLTELGKAYYERCKIVLAEAEAADALMSEHSSEPRGRLRVTMPVHFGKRCVMPALLSLAERFTEIELDLSFTDRLSDLAEDGFDLAIRTGNLTDSSAQVTRRLATQRMIVVGSPAYLARHGTPQSLADLQEHQTVVYRRTGPVDPWLFREGPQKTAEVSICSRLRFDDLDAIADATVAGAGLAWLPSWLVRAHIGHGKLVEILPREIAYPYDVHALWLQTALLPTRIRLAVDELAKTLPSLM